MNSGAEVRGSERSGSTFSAVKIAEKIYWVGVIDWGIRDFHGYRTSRGTTYNAYLILADKITLIDTVKAGFLSEMISRVASAVDPRKIDYIVSNHSEPDHTGELLAALEVIQPEKVFASKMGAKAIRQYYGVSEVIAVENGGTLDLGGERLRFTETRMLHWPDSMFTYAEASQILFSQDAFGMHLASSERFADRIDRSLLLEEAAKYYANIVMPYAPVVRKTLETLEKQGLSLSIVAPDHGPIYRDQKDISWILESYRSWAEKKPRRKAVVVFDTMWHSTESMARAIEEGLTVAGAEVAFHPLGSSHRSDVATDVLDAGALIVGSPTINNNLFPTVADTLSYLKGLKPTNLKGFAFGSYGWSGEAPRQIDTLLREMGVEVVEEPLRIQYAPSDADLQRCRDLGERLGHALGDSVQGT